MAEKEILALILEGFKGLRYEIRAQSALILLSLCIIGMLGGAHFTVKAFGMEFSTIAPSVSPGTAEFHAPAQAITVPTDDPFPSSPPGVSAASAATPAAIPSP